MGDAHLIRLGNPAVHEAQSDGGVVTGHVPRDDLGAQVTEVHLPAADAAPLVEHADRLAEALASYGRESFLIRLLTANPLEDWEIAFKHVALVCSQHARKGIDWVQMEDAGLQAALAAFLDAKEGEQSGYGQKPLEDVLELARTEERDWDERAAAIEGPTALKMKKGYDVILGASFGTSPPAPANYVAISASETAPVNTDTTLAGEIVTGGGGLIRKQATYAHTTETLTATLTVTLTANGSDTLPVTAHKMGTFNASSAGTMVLEDELVATTFNASGDNSTITLTLTLA